MTDRRKQHTTDRGAALVEYALGISLVVLVAIAAVDYLQSSEAEHLDSSSQRIGMPDLEATSSGDSSTSTPEGADPSDPASETAIVALDPPPVGTASAGEGNHWIATVELVATSVGGPLEGVVISGTWIPSANQSHTSCTTDAAGRCDVVRWNLSSRDNGDPSATFEITSIAGTGSPASGQIGIQVTVHRPGTTAPDEDEPSGDDGSGEG